MMKIVIQDTIFKADAEYPKRNHSCRNHLPFLPERMKIKKSNKLVCKRYDKNNYVAHIRTLKQALNHGLILKKCIDLIKKHSLNYILI